MSFLVPARYQHHWRGPRRRTCVGGPRGAMFALPMPNVSMLRTVRERCSSVRYPVSGGRVGR